MAERHGRRAHRRQTAAHGHVGLERGQPDRSRRVPVLPIAVAIVIGAVVIVIAAIAAEPGSPPQPLAQHDAPRRDTRLDLVARQPSAPARPVRSAQHVARARSAPVTVGETVVRFMDPLRTVAIGDRTVQRSFDAEVRYPVGLSGLFPLVVFGHGFNDMPGVYATMLESWAKAGYIVVAPVFPLENSHAPGGPTREDLHNQPADMGLVINSLLTPQTPTQVKVAKMTDLKHIAVSGQSDGGDTALAAAYGPSQYRAPDVDAAVILSGADDPLLGQFNMPTNGPPLLAVQGTADTINPPYQTHQFFDQAARPKYLLNLLGAGHQPPYTDAGADLTMIERVTIAFLNQYLKGNPNPLAQYVARGSAGPGSSLIANQSSQAPDYSHGS